MNNKINNIFNKNEIENKLKDFKEGQDYSIFPTDEPNIKTYNFHNDKLRIMFVGDKVPVKIAQETYDDKNYSYRGHFEEGKDYYYSHREWEGNPPTDENGWKTFSETMWKGGNGDYTKGSIRGRRLGNDSEPKKIEPNVNDFFGGNRTYLEELERKYGWEKGKLEEIENRSESDFGVDGKEKKKAEIAEVKNWITKIEREVERAKLGDYCGNCGIRLESNEFHDCVENPQHSDLVQENQELRQQLSEVKNQLAQVLEELKKLKSDINGKDSEKLEQQIVQNEKLIKDSENISVSEVQEQVNKSQALMNEINTNVSSNKDNKGGGSLPYVIGGSVILASAGIIGYLLLEKNKSKKVA